MDIEFIPPARWRPFLKSFTGAHRGWLITVDSARAASEPVCLMRNVPLVGVFDEPDRLVIAAGRGSQRVDRVVERPVTLRRPHTPDGADLGLDIETEGGEQVHLRFRSAVQAELVDGI